MTQREQQAQVAAEFVRKVVYRGKTPARGFGHDPLYGLMVKAGAHAGKRPPTVAGLDSVDEHRKLLSTMVTMAMRIDRAETKLAKIMKAVKP